MINLENHFTIYNSLDLNSHIYTQLNQYKTVLENDKEDNEYILVNPSAHNQAFNVNIKKYKLIELAPYELPTSILNYEEAVKVSDLIDESDLQIKVKIVKYNKWLWESNNALQLLHNYMLTILN